MQNTTFFQPSLSQVLLLSPVPLAEMCNVFDDTMHRLGQEFFVLVVHDHDDEEFSMARRIVTDLSEGETVILEIIGIAGSGRVTRMCEFALSTARAKVKKFLGQSYYGRV